MMLEYDWGNPAAAAAAMMLFADEPAERHVFDGYAHSSGIPADFFQPVPSALFAGPARYGMGIPPAPARIGLNLGVRTYFASEDEMAVGRVCRRRVRTARCQAEGCGADLTHAKHYHRRHKVCEYHSKASIVVAAGLSQRFCQQCSRFHVLSEFDQGKRSCRKRLADHNRRRRKSQDLSTATIASSDNSTTNSVTIPDKMSTGKILFVSSSSVTNENNPSFLGCNADPASSITRISPAPPVDLGLGSAGIAVADGMSGTSSTGTSPASVSFLSHLGDFRASEHRFPSWDEAEDGSCIREFFQQK